MYDWPDDVFKKYIEDKSANLVVQANYLATYKGLPARCTGFMMGDHSGYRLFKKRVRTAFPDNSVDG